jgi:hypothetical protein
LKDDHVDARENLAALLESQGRIAEAVEQRQIALRQREARPLQVRGNVLEKRVYLIGDLIEVKRLDDAQAQLDIARNDAANNSTILQLLDELQQKLRQSALAPSTAQ